MRTSGKVKFLHQESEVVSYTEMGWSLVAAVPLQYANTCNGQTTMHTDVLYVLEEPEDKTHTNLVAERDGFRNESQTMNRDFQKLKRESEMENKKLDQEIVYLKKALEDTRMMRERSEKERDEAVKRKRRLEEDLGKVRQEIGGAAWRKIVESNDGKKEAS